MPTDPTPAAIRVLVASHDAARRDQWLAALREAGFVGESCIGAVEALCRLSDAAQPACRLLLIDPGLAGMGALALAVAAAGLPNAPVVASVGTSPSASIPALPWPWDATQVTQLLGGPRARPTPVTRQAAATGRLVLLVEDNEVNRMIAARMLGMLGYRSRHAVDGAAAVAAFREGGIDAVLMDVQMPVMDGYEATRAIRAGEQPGSHVPIIGLSAHALPEDRDLALAAGMDDYLTKPVVMDVLRAALRRWLFGSSTEIPAMVQPDPVVVLDREVVEKLKAFGVEVMRELLNHLIMDLPAKRAAIAGQLAQGDLAGAQRTAHALKGSSGSVGAMRLMHAAARLMDVCKAGDAAAARQMARQLEAEAEATTTAILDELR